MRTCAAALALLLIAGSAAAQDLARGVVVDDVKCLADPAQSYALYLPSGYAHDKTWSVILAFHPAARGRQMVEKYQAAAEQYGYVIAASNNSRNGPWAVSAAAAQAMWGDVVRRFAIDERRIYLAGMSGGARVAMEIALANKAVAGGDRIQRRVPGQQAAGVGAFRHLRHCRDRRLQPPRDAAARS